MINNKWTKGPMRWSFPPLPPTLRGMNGCRLEKMVFDDRIGEETVLIILENDLYAHELAETKPFEVYCSSGMVETSHGEVIFLLFTVKTLDKDLVTYEVLMNPYSEGTKQLLTLWSKQTHLKVFLLENQQGEELNWYEFVNNFEIDRLMPLIENFVDSSEYHDFALAQQEFYDDNDLEELKRMCS